MLLSEIRDEVSILVKDVAFDDDVLDRYINQAINYLNSIIELPGRKSIGTVDSELGQCYVELTSLTGGFNTRLSKVSVEGEPIKLYDDLESLFDYYIASDNTDLLKAGNIEGVALEGNTLWYQYVPAEAATITVVYYRGISELTTDSSDPSLLRCSIPEGLHRKLLVHGAAWIAWDEIEEDVEEAKVNAMSHFYHSFSEDNKDSGLTKLREWIGRNRRHYISSTWSV